jgi:hypothetical protein
MSLDSLYDDLTRPSMPTDPAETRTWILDKAATLLADAVADLSIGIRWLDVVEAGSLDRAREALRVVAQFAEHASELAEISTTDRKGSR